MEKTFSYKGIALTRYDYESLPCPMAASQLNDETMQKIAETTHTCLVNKGWSQDDIDEHLFVDPRPDAPDEEVWMADRLRSDFWEFMEEAAIYHGMKYYEDMEDEDQLDLPRPI